MLAFQVAAQSHLWHKSVYTSTPQKIFWETVKVTAKGEIGELITLLFMTTEFSPSQQKVERNTFGQEDPSDLYADGV